jgi:cytidine deaminase
MNMTEQELFELAIGARGRSYAPYSGFTVGAALLCTDGTVFTGSNIENASYPMGMCAERTAIFKAASEGKRLFCMIAVAGGPAGSGRTACCPPCGACRQVMREFAGPDFIILFSDGGGGFAKRTLKELLPDDFGPESLS